MQLQPIWRAIEEALGPRRGALRTPASAAAVKSLERGLGFPLPAPLRASLSIHDGARGMLWSNEMLLGAREIALRAKMLRELKLLPPHTIPLTDADGDGFFLDGRGRVVYVHHDGARPPRIVAPSYEKWLASIPRRISEEARQERKTTKLLGEPSAPTARERARLKKLDEELPHLVSYTCYYHTWARRRPTRAALAAYRPIARLPVEEIVARAFERGFLRERNGFVEATPRGRELL